VARQRKLPKPPALPPSARIFLIEAAHSARLALFALSIAACGVFLSWMRHAAA
jgi:hypothetical protein